MRGLERPPVVVVTGASAGIGRAVVREYARRHRGTRFGLIARGIERLEATRREVIEAGGEALVISCDVADADAVEAAAGAVEEAFGPIDVWINNAMASVFGLIKDVSPAEIRRVTDVTYHGAVHGTLSALRRMLPRDHGVIVQVGSLLASRAIPLQAAYCAAKHALRGFTESLRTELLHEQSSVAVTMVQLPAVNTPQFSWSRTHAEGNRELRPLGVVYQPEPIARGIVDAAEHPRRQVLVGGSILAPFVGQKLAPGVIDRVLARKGVDGQLKERAPGERVDNLFAPVPGDQAARGDIERARETSLQAWMNRHRNKLALATLALAAFGVVTLRR